jgi:GNAT superfamily N-acetyltransferase
VDREVADRIAAGLVAAWRHRVAHLPGHVVAERDGIVVCLSNLSEILNVALVEHEPTEPARALEWAERVFASHDQPLGIEVEAGRHREVDRTVRSMGLVVEVARPAMAIRIDDLTQPHAPSGVEIHRVDGAEEVAVVADLEVRVFETPRDVAERFVAPAMLDVAGTRLYLATAGGSPVGFCWTSASAGALGVFGVGVLSEHRRRGIGRAVTSFAIHDAPGIDLAWLQPTELGRPLYDAMSFTPYSEWEVWVRP